MWLKGSKLLPICRCTIYHVLFFLVSLVPLALFFHPSLSRAIQQQVKVDVRTSTAVVWTSTDVLKVPASTGVLRVPASTGVPRVPASTGVLRVPASTGVQRAALDDNRTRPDVEEEEEITGAYWSKKGTKSLRDSQFIVRSPEERLKCIESVIAPFITQIERLRIEMIKTNDPWVNYETNNASRFTAFSENRTFFQDIWKYENVKTVFLEESMATMAPCLLGDGNLHYDFGINNCLGVWKSAKRHVMFGEPIYGMSCVRDPPSVMATQPLKEEALQVGLPARYAHKQLHKTWSYLHVIKNAVVTVYGDVTTGSLDIISQRCFQNKLVDLPVDPGTLPLYDEVFSASLYYGKGMFHANIEDVSRLAPYVSFLQRHPDIKIHVFDLENPPAFLSLLDLDPTRFINGTVRAKILHQPPGINCCLPTLFGTQVESLHMRKNLPNAKQDTVILIRRTRRRNRFFANHRKILKMLEKEAPKQNLRVFVFRDDPVPPLNVTALLFNRALMVVAPHGAGQSNLIFTQPGTLLLEGLCVDRSDGLVNVVFRTLSHILAGHYFGYFKPDDHCTETTAEELQPYVRYFLQVLSRQNRK